MLSTLIVDDKPVARRILRDELMSPVHAADSSAALLVCAQIRSRQKQVHLKPHSAWLRQ
jgi:hypothetical protein